MVRQALTQPMDINEVVYWARQYEQSEAAKRDLLECFMDADNRVASNALWVATHMTHAQLQWFVAVADRLIDAVLVADHPTRKRLLLNVLLELDVTYERIDFLDFCLALITLPTEPVGIRSLCIKHAYRMALPYPELCHELRVTLELLQPHEMSAGLRHARNTTLKALAFVSS